MDTIGPMYEVAATTLSYHFCATPRLLLKTWRSSVKRSIVSAVVSRKRRLAKSAISCPSSQNAIRPSRWPGVLALTINS